MREYLAAVRAIPVIAAVYVSMLVRRSVAARLGLALGVGGLLGLGVLGIIGPAGTVARPASETIVAAAAPEADTRIEVGRSPTAGVSITFGAPMDVASVNQMIVVTPGVPVELSWDPTVTRLTVSPRTAWPAATYHTITVRAGALAVSGRPTATDIRAAFLTRAATVLSVRPTVTIGDAAGLDSGVELTVDRPIDPASLVAAFTIDPPVPGTLEPQGRRGAADTWLFQPDEPLEPDSTYRITFGATVLDHEGGPVVTPPAVDLVTGSTPSVVRFRPRNSTSDVDRSATLSVRFMAPMDRASTAAAWSALDGTEPIPGTISWAEDDTVLVFNMKAALGYSAKVTMSVGDGAISAAGVPIAAAATATFTTLPKPAVKAAPNAAPNAPSGGSGGSGGAVGAGTWGAVETYYLKLMNCTRTGGLVTSTGGCSSPGSRNVAALFIDTGISSKVSRPYAKKLATNNLCTHFSGGNPGDRLRAAGYTNYVWAENLGCRSGDPYAAVLGSHLYFQGERSWSPLGGHYVNLMNANYDRVGIGVWASSGRSRLVVNFYHP